MKFDKISVNELLPTGSFLNTRIEVSCSLDEGEDPKEAAKIAYQLLHEIHRENFPSMYSDNKPIYKGEEELPVVQQQKRFEIFRGDYAGMDAEGEAIDEINACTYIQDSEKEVGAGLKSFKLLNDQNPNTPLSAAYAAKYNELLDNGLMYKPN